MKLTAERIVEKLVNQGMIPPEHATDATRELDRELRRRSLRIVAKLARAASRSAFISLL